MNLLTIAVGKSRFEKNWINKEVKWEQLKDKLRAAVRTPETVTDFHAFKKEAQDGIKDVGGFVGGSIIGQRRVAGNIPARSLLTLDFDNASPYLWSRFTLLYECAAALYSTHKHTVMQPRYRLVIPLLNPIEPDKYVPVMRKVAQDLGIEQVDPTCYQVHRLMYWPSAPIDGDFVFLEQEGKFLDADNVLSQYSDWRNANEWPYAKGEKKILHDNVKKQQNPKNKPGIIGAFNNVYGIGAVINAYLSDVYAPSGLEGRYTFKSGSTSSGAIVYNDEFLYSHHSTDPVCGVLCNSFDLVRLHKFGSLDDGSADSIPANKKQSFKAMCDFIIKDEAVKIFIGKEKTERAAEMLKTVSIEDISVSVNNEGQLVAVEEDDWMKNMDMDRKGNYLTTINNIALILENDIVFKNNLAYDSFSERALFKKGLPWRKFKSIYGSYLTEFDLSNIENYIEKVYKITCGKYLEKGFNVVLERNKFNPVRSYLETCRWDGMGRIDTLLIDYLGCADNEYTRQVTRKTLVACVARVMEPGIKFDYILTLIGNEGQGKSQLFDRLGGRWFSDTFSLYMLKGKEAFEQLQGKWIIEIGELSGMVYADIERVKSFVASRCDSYRAAYGRVTGIKPRQCVMVATTNDFSPLRSNKGNRRFWPVETHVTTPVASVFSIDENTVDMIWAEALQLYNEGEEIFLSPEMEATAKKVQESFTEEDPLLNQIINYLQYRVPDNWYNMDVWDKKDFIRNYKDENTFERTEICAYEIWEMVLNKKEIIGRHELKIIKQAFRNIPGWEVSKDDKRFGKSYPKHRGWLKKGKNNPSKNG